jgi:hypothetical protein
MSIAVCAGGLIGTFHTGFECIAPENQRTPPDLGGSDTQRLQGPVSRLWIAALPQFVNCGVLKAEGYKHRSRDTLTGRHRWPAAFDPTTTLCLEEPAMLLVGS